MKIYTKILLGMAVGIVLGLTVGPKSSFLEHDLYRASDGQKYEVYLNVVQHPERTEGRYGFKWMRESTRLDLPAQVSIDFIGEGVVEREVKDSSGKGHTSKVWVKGYFVLDDRLLLRDKSGTLKEQLKGKKPGDKIAAWLKLRHIALDDSVQSLPIPISNLGDAVISYLKPIGSLFLRLIKMVIVPLVFSSLLVGIASLGDIRKLGRMGGRTLGLYILTTAVAVSIGLLCAHLIEPGSYIQAADKASLVAQFADAAGSKASSAAAAPSTMDNILGIIPLNPVGSLASGNMLQIIFFAVIFGIALTMLEDNKAEIVVTFFDRVQEAMVLVIHMVMVIAPFGVAALVADVIGSSGASILFALAVYALTVLAGLAIHAGVVYGGLVVTFAKLKWMDFMRAIRPAQLIAFSTSSSSATLPVSMECAEENLGISNSVSSFVLPLGSTVNMDGTALYQGVAAIFIAQVFGIDLSLADQLTIVLTATMASVGAAGVPGAGMVTLAMVLTATGIPQVGIALILGMDRLLDMFRTAVNVTGDLAVTSVMASAEGETLTALTPEADAKSPDQGFEGRLEGDERPIEPAPAPGFPTDGTDENS